MRVLFTNKSGAVLVLATFFAILLSGLLYHVIGVGEGAMEATLMQNTADSAVYSAATAKARCMNAIALINLVMATVLAVLVAIRLLMVVIGVVIAALGVACVVSMGAACGATAPLIAVENNLHGIAEDLEGPIKEILNALSKAQDVIVDAAPILAEADAVVVSTQEGGNTATGAIVIPPFKPLPVKRGNFETLCQKAAEQVVAVAGFFLPGDMGAEANSTIGKVLGEMAGRFSGYFCGESGSAPPSSFAVDKALPMSSNTDCENAAALASSGAQGCASTRCIRCAADACRMCLPKMEQQSYREGSWQVTEEVWLETASEGRAPMRNIVESTGPVIRTIDGDPCAGEADCSKDPLCTVTTRLSESRSGTTVTVRSKVITYMKLTSCIVSDRVAGDPEAKPLNASDWPKPMELDSDAPEEAFEMRSIALGSGRSDMRTHRVALVKEGGDNPRVSVAAAAFGSLDNDLWHMNWKSRLIRFRIPGGGLSGECEGAGSSACSQGISRISEITEAAGDWLIH